MHFTMNRSTLLNLYCFMITNLIIAQTGTLSNSPYSLYGLGLENYLNIGKTNAFGNSGMAMPSNSSINNLNPASFGAIPLNSFMFDIGLKTQVSFFQEGGLTQSKSNSGFTNLAFAFALTKKSGLGITLLPYTNVGYGISGIETDIEGSNDVFFTEVTGEGGLNDIKVNYGYSFSSKFRIGVAGSYLFGKITENEINYIEPNILHINEESSYSGFRFAAGVQYEPFENISFGFTINSPVHLKGNQTYVVNQVLEDGATNEVFGDNKADGFSLPWEIGTGVSLLFKDRFTFYLDYKRSFWEDTNQTDRLGEFVNKDFIGLGMEYLPQNRAASYWNRIQYRAGLRYDNGNLSVNKERVNGFAINLGLGFPIRQERKSMLNFAYSYGQEGQISNGLIKENYHMLTLNISLEDLWFVKSLYD